MKDVSLSKSEKTTLVNDFTILFSRFLGGRFTFVALFSDEEWLSLSISDNSSSKLFNFN